MLTLLVLAQLQAAPVTAAEVVQVMAEKGCPRLFALLSPDFQKAVPKDQWPAFCDSVGNLGPLGTKRTEAGWEVYSAANDKGAFELRLALDAAGKVSGLSVEPSPAKPEAPTYTSATLKPLLEEIVRARQLPGIAALALKDSLVLEAQVAGVRKLGDPTPVQLTDAWHLGSDTKTMTAVMAGMLVESGKWKWTSTVADLFPRLKSLHPKFKTVTLEMLLQHRSGLVPNIPKALWTKPPEQVANAHRDRKYLIDALLALAPNDPGTYVYSNAGYMVVGAAMEQALGKPWEQLIHDKLFQPLKMTTCGFGVQASSPAVTQPWPHVWKDGKPAVVEATWRADNPPSLGPAGTVHCSIGDWAKFIMVFTTDDARGLVSKATVERLTTPNGDYALGWGVRKLDWTAEPALTHSGSNTMNFATVWVFPKLKVGLLAATNLGEERVATAALKDVFSFLAEQHAGKKSKAQ